MIRERGEKAAPALHAQRCTDNDPDGLGHQLIRPFVDRYRNADAVHRLLVRCLLSALAFPAGAIVMAVLELR